MHVTLKLQPGLPSLRVPALKACVEQAIDAGHERFGMKLLQHTLEKDGLSLLVTAPHRRALSRGIQGISVRIARAVNRKLERKGRLFADRYDAQLASESAGKGSPGKVAAGKGGLGRGAAGRGGVGKGAVRKPVMSKAVRSPATRSPATRSPATRSPATRSPATRTKAAGKPVTGAGVASRATARKSPARRAASLRGAKAIRATARA